MTELVNLNRYKKRVVRERDAEAAKANRAKFGRTKAARHNEASERQRAEASIDRHKLLRESGE